MLYNLLFKYINMQSFCFFGSPKEVGCGAKPCKYFKFKKLILTNYTCLGIYK